MSIAPPNIIPLAYVHSPSFSIMPSDPPVSDSPPGSTIFDPATGKIWAKDQNNTWILVVSGVGGGESQDSVYNVKEYGAKGDGVTDDSAAINATIQEALSTSGVVLFPSGTYLINSPLLCVGTGTQSLRMQGTSSPTGINIVYAGPPNTSVIQLLGLSYCWFQKIGVSVQSGIAKVVVWDQQFTTSLPNALGQRWDDCVVTFPNNPYSIAWRIGQATDGLSNVAYYPVWHHCTALDQTNGSFCVGFQMGGAPLGMPGGQNPSWYSCRSEMSGVGLLLGARQSILSSSITASQTTIPVNDTSLFPIPCVIWIAATGEQIYVTDKTPGTFATAGTLGTAANPAIRGYNGTTPTACGGGSVEEYVTNQGVYTGYACSGSWVGGGFGGFGLSGNDIVIGTGGYLRVDSALCQVATPSAAGVPRRALQIGYGAGGLGPRIYLSNSMFRGYAQPPDNKGVILNYYNSEIHIKGCDFPFGSALTAFSATNPLINDLTNNVYGSIVVEQCTVYGTVPFITTAANKPYIFHRHVQLYDNTGHITTLKPVLQEYVAPVTLTDAATVNVDFSQGKQFLLVMNNTLGNRTIAFLNATYGHPRVTIVVKQPASGAAQTITWPAINWQGGTTPTLSTTNAKADIIDVEQAVSGTYFGTAKIGY